MSDLYLGEILKSRGCDIIEESFGVYDDISKDTRIITFIIDYIREQDYIDVSKLSDQKLYDMVQGYLEQHIPAYQFMEELEIKYRARSNDTMSTN